MKDRLSYAEYQDRLKTVRTPEEAAAFAQELLAPMLAGMARKTRTVVEEEEPEEAEEVPTPASRERVPRKPIVPRAERQGAMPSPWFDVVANDTEAMVVSLYAKGLTTRDIVSHLKRACDVEMSQPNVSAITDKVYPLVKEWQSRPLSSCYPILYLDGLHFKVRETGKIISKIAYIALGISQYGSKEVLGIWTSDSEGAKFWMGVLTDLKNRGVDDVFIACVDGLKGFPEAIKTVFPHTEVQICIAHQIRHTMKFVPFKDRKAFCESLKEIYTAPNEEAGMDALKVVADRWPQYRSYLKSWENRWGDLARISMQLVGHQSHPRSQKHPMKMGCFLNVLCCMHMRKIHGANFTVFLLFFCIALIEALQNGDRLQASLFAALGVLSLWADFKK